MTPEQQAYQQQLMQQQAMQQMTPEQQAYQQQMMQQQAAQQQQGMSEMQRRALAQMQHVVPRAATPSPTPMMAPPPGVSQSSVPGGVSMEMSVTKSSVPGGPVSKEMFDRTGASMDSAIAAAPVVIPGEARVILHTMEGQVKRGALRDADLAADVVELHLTNGGVEAVPRGRVKAVFFMLAPGSKVPEPNGDKVRVTFKDGRQVAGFSQDHRQGGVGFFVVPADNRTNTQRIFIFRHSLQNLSIGA